MGTKIVNEVKDFTPREKAIYNSIQSSLRQNDVQLTRGQLIGLKRKLEALPFCNEVLNLMLTIEFKITVNVEVNVNQNSEDYLYWDGEKVPAEDFHRRIRSEKMQNKHRREEEYEDRGLKREMDFKDEVVEGAGKGFSGFLTKVGIGLGMALAGYAVAKAEGKK